MDPSAPAGAPSVASTIHALGETLAADDVDRGEGSSSTAVPTSARYRSRGVLGEGGMGRVSHVYDADLMRDLAIKELRPERKGSDEMLRQFLWEARVTAHLDHPNIVPLHELGLGEEGDPWFSMKLVRGRSLEDALEGLRRGDPEDASRLPPARRLRLFLQLGQAIDFAHSRGVLHRDLKPANVMLGDHGELYVMDWGIAVPLDGSAGEAISACAPPQPVEGRISGTPLYMSPEQAQGAPLDVRSDVYTLGVILYELVALRRPYRGDSIPEIILAITDGEVVPIAEAGPEVSPSLAAVIERAMALQPEDRYATVGELLREVELVLDGGTPRAESADLVRRVGRFYVRERHPWLRHANMLDFELMMGAAATFGAAAALLLSGGPTGWAMGLLGVSLVTWGVGMLGWLRRLRRGRDGDPAE